MEQRETELKKKTRQPKKNIKELMIILLIIICLGLGYFAGYSSKKTQIIKEEKASGVIDEAYGVLKDHWVNATDQKVDFNSSIISGMIDGLGDPHSAYFTSDGASKYNQTVSGNYQGIGVGFSMVSSGAMITKVYDKSPALDAGLKVGDIISQVESKKVSGLSTDELKELVRGEEGTEVELTILRDQKSMTVKVTRKALDVSTFYEIRKNNNVPFGYIQLTTFGTNTAQQFEEALEYFKKNNVENLVIDLRDNGGGYLTAAEGILDLFFTSDEVIYQMKEKNDSAKKHYAKSDTCYKFKNGYILVNGNSASASEFTAGALQSEKGFKLIGEKTYGKGSVQTQKVLSDGSVLKYTYAKWMIPNGTCINGKGLQPDIEVKNDSLDDIKIDDFKNTLKIDCVDEHVKSMQKMLKILGYQVDREDGYFSKATQDALSTFEKDNQLTVNGEYTNDDKNMLVAKIMIHINNHENDKQYAKLLTYIQ